MVRQHRIPLQTPFTPYALEQIRQRQELAASPSPSPTPSTSSMAQSSKILVSGLPDDVTESQIRELFQATVGPVVRAELSFDAHGRSKGIATVEFVATHAAAEAQAQYNNKLIDGLTPMTIELVGGACASINTHDNPSHTPGSAKPHTLTLKQRMGLAAPAVSRSLVRRTSAPLPSRMSGATAGPTTTTQAGRLAGPQGNSHVPFSRSGAGPGRGRGFGQGRGRGRGTGVTVAELDAEMDMYRRAR